MIDRRSFITNGLTAIGTATLCSNARAEAPRANESLAGSYHYRLPSFKKGSRLLFQGDSITDMNWGRNQSDRNHYLGHSFVYLIAARLGVDMPEAQLDIYNRGMSGHTVGDLRKRWNKDAIEMKPDVLSILIGTNDVGRGVQKEAFEADYRSILDASRNSNPDLRLVLLEPFVLPTGKLKDEQAWASRRSATDALGTVVARLAKDYQAVHIKTQDIFDTAAKAVTPEQWIWDGVHPLPQGHELIARNWLQEVSARWPHS
jgi:lysophospholipase L1-like esterase